MKSPTNDWYRCVGDGFGAYLGRVILRQRVVLGDDLLQRSSARVVSVVVIVDNVAVLADGATPNENQDHARRWFLEEGE